MAQETNILIEISDDGLTWNELITLNPDLTAHNHVDISNIGTAKYYRLIAKGDGINTLDSPPSAVVSINNGWTVKYQAVLTYAAGKGYTAPSTAQNIINDTRVRILDNLGLFTKFDRFYWFNQEAGLSAFAKIDWVNPADNTNLLDIGANPVTYTPDSGFQVAGGNNQYFSMQYTPSIHAVNFSANSRSFVAKIFDHPTTFTEVTRLFGGAGASGQTINMSLLSQDNILPRFCDNGAGTTLPFTQLNKHLYMPAWNASGLFKKLYVDGEFLQDLGAGSSVGLPTGDVHLFSVNINGTHYPSEAGFGYEYFGLGSDLRLFQDLIHQGITGALNLTHLAPDGVLGITAAADSAMASLMFPTVYRTDKFPMLTGLSKKYFMTYSTDHATSTLGTCAVGEMDNLDLSDFTELGVIISGNQSETPYVFLSPNDPDGQIVHFGYHPNGSYPDSGGIQQTRVLTRAGGSLIDQAGWTDRGKVLGLTAEELALDPHTGYANFYPQPNGDIICIHNTKGQGTTGTKQGKSISTDGGRTYTRITSDLDNDSYMPMDRQFIVDPSLYFTRNGKQYVAAKSRQTYNDTQYTLIAVCECLNGDFIPTDYLGVISGKNSGYGCTDLGFFIDEETPNIIRIYYILNSTDMYYTTWDLTNLD